MPLACLLLVLGRAFFEGRARARPPQDDGRRLERFASTSRSPLRVALRAVLLDERLHGLDRLHRVGVERMLVDEGVGRALQVQDVHIAAGAPIGGGKALLQFDRGPAVLGALEHQGGRHWLPAPPYSWPIPAVFATALHFAD